MQRDRPTKHESDHMNRVRQLGCIVCEEAGVYTPALVHHCDTGMGRHRNHFKTIPLCDTHHSPYSKCGLHHMGKKAWAKKYNTENYYLERVKELLEEKYGEIQTDI